MKNIAFLFILSCLFFSCESELQDFQVKNQSTAIVVYGELGNGTNPCKVRINYPSAYSPYDITQFVGKPVKNATVSIIDGLGNRTALTETQEGFYESNALFRAVTNQSYKLSIKTADGLQIESTLEKLNPAPILNDFSYKFVDAEKVENMRFDINAELKDPKETTDYYFIKRQDFVEFLTTCLPPPPPPQPVPPCYSKCWRAPLNTQPILLSDFLINGKNIPLNLNSIDVHDITNWVIQLDVFSVSKGTYDYWKRQEEQRVIGGGLFDKIPAQITGNLTCINKPEQQILGLFFVGGVSKQRLTIDRMQLVGEDKFSKILNYVEFNKIRYPETPLNKCDEAGFVNYNIGRVLPGL